MVIRFSKKVAEPQAVLELNKVLYSYETFEIAAKDLKHYLIKNPKNANIIFNPSNDLKWSLNVSENEIRSPTYVAHFTDGVAIKEDSSVMYSSCNTYAGIANNDASQFVRLYVDNNVIRGVIFDKSAGYVEIYPLSDLTNLPVDSNTYIIFKHKDLKEVVENCPVKSVSTKIQNSVKGARTATPTACRVLEIATDADYEWYQSYGSNSNSSILSTLNTLDGVYNSAFNLRILVVFQNVYTSSSDPYSSTDDLGLIEEFRNYWNTNRGAVERDLAHLFSGKYIEDDDGEQVFGLAFMSVLCDSPANSYGYTLDRISYFETTAHEIGHNLGGDHPDFNGPQCFPNKTLMCQGTPKLMSFSSASITEISNYISANESCLLDLSGIYVLGNEVICSSGTFSVNSPLNIGSISWSSSNPSILTINSSTGAATRTGSAYGQVIITATLNSICTSGTISFTKTIWVGEPDLTKKFNGVIAGTTSVSAGSLNLLEAFPNMPGFTYNYNDYDGTGDISVTLYNPNSANTNMYVGAYSTSGHRKVKVTITNACGSDNEDFVFYLASFFKAIYPNPAKDYLVVEFNDLSTTDGLPATIELINERSIQVERTLSMQDILKDTKNIKGNAYTIDVSRLERGIWYLRANSKNRNPEVVRILLE